MTGFPELEARLTAFEKLGQYLLDFVQHCDEPSRSLSRFEDLHKAIRQASLLNPWFTRDNILFSLGTWGRELTMANLETWCQPYSQELQKSQTKTVAVIMAGNIPLVGMHDFISTLLAGKSILVKLSGSDSELLPALARVLTDIEPGFEPHIHFTGDRIKEFDAVIATGSNNSGRYFEFYFSKVPNIIRGNRNGVAILTGSETDDELLGLGSDICRYFGLGCRNISKIFIPSGYNFAGLLGGCDPFYQSLFSHHKYMNNYAYQKTILSMNLIPFSGNDILLFTENTHYSSPVSVIYFEHYNDLDQLSDRLKADKDQIQCIVSTLDAGSYIKPGMTQKPELWEYADGVNTLEFLISL